jgi:DNA-binding FrmR family transcriptional regulator
MCPNCCDKKTIRNDLTKEDYIKRLNRIIGQLNGIKNMVEEDKYCADILIQVSAAEKALKSLGNKILDAHMHTCVKNGIKEGNEELIDEVLDLIRRFN